MGGKGHGSGGQQNLPVWISLKDFPVVLTEQGHPMWGSSDLLYNVSKVSMFDVCGKPR